MATKRISTELEGESAIDADIMYASLNLSAMSKKEADNEFIRIAMIALNTQMKRTALAKFVKHPTIREIEQFCASDLDPHHYSHLPTETACTLDVTKTPELVSDSASTSTVTVDDIMRLIDSRPELRESVIKMVAQVRDERASQEAPKPMTGTILNAHIIQEADDGVAASAERINDRVAQAPGRSGASPSSVWVDPTTLKEFLEAPVVGVIGTPHLLNNGQHNNADGSQEIPPARTGKKTNTSPKESNFGGSDDSGYADRPNE